VEISTFLQLFFSGMLQGTTYALVALGLTLIFSILDSINFAHGDMFMLGSFATYYLFSQLGINQLHLPVVPTYLVTMVITMVIVGLLGVVIEMGIFHPFIGKHLQGVILTLGLGLILQMSCLMAFGVQDKGASPAFTGITKFSGAILPNDKISVAFLALILITGLWYLVQRTKLGLALRAVSQDREAASLQGISMRKICAIGFGIGCSLAAGAGALVAPTTFISPFVGEPWLMKSFIIIIVGGMGSIPGSLLGGFLIGITESFWTFFFNVYIASILSFALVIVILLLRPRGLMGKA